MKKYISIIGVLAFFKLLIQCIGNRNYGFQRDELLHLSAAEHMDWGFMEFPPLIAGVAKVAIAIFGISLPGVRLFSTLAGVTILILCCLMAKEFGGKNKAILLSGIFILAFVPFYRNHTLLQPVVFDQLFWTLGFYILIRFINSENKKLLLLLGISTGLGLLTKYTIAVWIFGVLLGLLWYKKAAIYRNPWFYMAMLLALLIFFPNILWQLKHDIPFLKHLKALNEQQLDSLSPFDFLLGQLESPFTFCMVVIGLFFFFVDGSLKKYKSIGIAVSFIFIAFWIVQAKVYYVFPVYPVLFASAAVKIEEKFQKNPVWIYTTGVITLLPSIFFIPMGTPILPIDTYVAYRGLQKKNERIQLTSDYADMFGWEEQVRALNRAYTSLSREEQRACLIWASNYGEAGAVEILGKKYKLPQAISKSGSFWLWGPGALDTKVWIVIGYDKQDVENVFEAIELVSVLSNTYAVEEENHVPIYICRTPKVAIPKLWSSWEDSVFE